MRTPSMSFRASRLADLIEKQQKARFRDVAFAISFAAITITAVAILLR